MTVQTRRPWHLYVLILAGVALVALAITEIGPPSSTARTSKQIVTAQKGVVQSTVSGSGNVEAGSDVSVNFQTSGTLEQVYVKVGEHVDQGQLLATLDSTSARLSVEQAQKNLTAAEDQLTTAESNSSSSSTTTSYDTRSSSATAEFVSATLAPSVSRSTTTTTGPATTTTPTSPTTTTPAPTTTTTGPATTTTPTSPTTTTPAPTTTTPATTPTTTQRDDARLEPQQQWVRSRHRCDRLERERCGRRERFDEHDLLGIEHRLRRGVGL